MILKQFTAIILASVLSVSIISVNVSADKWDKTEKGYVYTYDNGTTAKAGWLKIGKDTFYIQKDGTRKTGWLKTSSAKYYFDKNGKMYKNQWVDFKDGNKYYFMSNGKVATGIVTIETVDYKFNSDGEFLGKNYHFIVNTETLCLHSSNCRAAKKIDKEHFAKIDIGSEEISDYKSNGYWACGVKGCNTKEIKKELPKS